MCGVDAISPRFKRDPFASPGVGMHDDFCKQPARLMLVGRIQIKSRALPSYKAHSATSAVHGSHVTAPMFSLSP